MTLQVLFEDVQEIVSNWAVDVIQEIVHALIPDDRPFGFQEQSIEEQINEYILLRSNPNAWLEYIQTNAQLIEQKLQEASVPPDLIASVHPFDISVKFSLAYSAYMEDQLRARSV